MAEEGQRERETTRAVATPTGECIGTNFLPSMKESNSSIYDIRINNFLILDQFTLSNRLRLICSMSYGLQCFPNSGAGHPGGGAGGRGL